MSTDGPTEAKSPQPPGTDVAIVASFIVWGVLFRAFPSYAGFTHGWASLFHLLSFVLLAIGFLGSLATVSALMKSKFIEYSLVAIILAVISFLLHLASVPFGGLPRYLLRFIVLVLISLATAAMAMAFPFLLTGKGRQDERLPKKSSSEKALRVLLAALAVIAAALPVIEKWLEFVVQP